VHLFLSIEPVHYSHRYVESVRNRSERQQREELAFTLDWPILADLVLTVHSHAIPLEFLYRSNSTPMHVRSPCTSPCIFFGSGA
jgi:hypothetical protein